ASEIGGVVGENLRQSIEWLPQGRRLLTGKTDCNLPVKPTDLVIGAADIATLRKLYQRFEFKVWLRDLPSGDDVPADAAGEIAKKAARDDNGRRWDTNETPDTSAAPPLETRYEIVHDEQTLSRWLATVQSAELTSFDTETTSLDPINAEIVGISLCVEPGHACYVPVAHHYAGAPGQLDRDRVLAAFAP